MDDLSRSLEWLGDQLDLHPSGLFTTTRKSIEAQHVADQLRHGAEEITRLRAEVEARGAVKVIPQDVLDGLKVDLWGGDYVGDPYVGSEGVIVTFDGDFNLTAAADHLNGITGAKPVTVAEAARVLLDAPRNKDGSHVLPPHMCEALRALAEDDGEEG